MFQAWETQPNSPDPENLPCVAGQSLLLAPLWQSQSNRKSQLVKFYLENKMLLCLLLANAQPSKSSPLAICHALPSQLNLYTFSVTKIMVSGKELPGITWKWPEIEILIEGGISW